MKDSNIENFILGASGVGTCQYYYLWFNYFCPLNISDNNDFHVSLLCDFVRVQVNQLNHTVFLFVCVCDAFTCVNSQACICEHVQRAAEGLWCPAVSLFALAGSPVQPRA